MSKEFTTVESTELSSVAGGCHDNNNNNNNRRPFAYGAAASAGRNASAFAGWPNGNFQRSWRDHSRGQSRGMPNGYGFPWSRSWR